MTERLTVRALEPDDVDTVVGIALRAWAPVHASMASVLGKRLNRLVFPDWAASQEADVRAACATDGVWVAVDGASQVVGFVSVVIRSAAEGEIDMIAIDPSAQRRGIARVLTEHAIDRIRSAGCSLVSVATGGDSGHAPARALYEACGFTALPLVRYYRAV